MIKRLKWDVLHGGGGGEESDGGLSSSDESDAGDVQAANELMADLVANDPVLCARAPVGLVEFADHANFFPDQFAGRSRVGAKKRGRKTGSTTADAHGHRKRHNLLGENLSDSDDSCHGSDGSSSFGNGVDAGADSDDSQDRASGHVDEFANIAPSEGGMNDPDESGPDGDAANEGGSCVTWRECSLCPGKRFLNDREVADHLKSKRHVRAVARHEKLNVQETPEPSQHSGANNSKQSIAVGLSNAVSKPFLDEGENLGDGADNSREKIPRGVGSSASGSQAVCGLPPRSINSERREESRGEGDVPDSVAEERVRKRKAAVKRKLKMKKQRKWERLQGIGKSEEGGPLDRNLSSAVAKAVEVGPGSVEQNSAAASGRPQAKKKAKAQQKSSSPSKKRVKKR